MNQPRLDFKDCIGILAKVEDDIQYLILNETFKNSEILLVIFNSFFLNVENSVRITNIQESFDIKNRFLT